MYLTLTPFSRAGVHMITSSNVPVSATREARAGVTAWGPASTKNELTGIVDSV